MKNAGYLDNLLDKVSAIYDVTPEEVKGDGREKRIVHVRQVVSAVARHRKYKYLQIGKFLNMDHSSVQYYVKERPRHKREQELIDYLTDTSELIRETAEKLAKTPDDKYLKRLIVRLIVNE